MIALVAAASDRSARVPESEHAFLVADHPGHLSESEERKQYDETHNANQQDAPWTYSDTICTRGISPSHLSALSEEICPDLLSKTKAESHPSAKG